ncbi:MAG: hypothetical protein H0V53_04710, partial [Rubrobacter sp.]|nr:hypothetical protein [Rubrobacter sp.]
MPEKKRPTFADWFHDFVVVSAHMPEAAEKRVEPVRFGSRMSDYTGELSPVGGSIGGRLTEVVGPVQLGGGSWIEGSRLSPVSSGLHPIPSALGKDTWEQAPAPVTLLEVVSMMLEMPSKLAEGFSNFRYGMSQAFKTLDEWEMRLFNHGAYELLLLRQEYETTGDEALLRELVRGRLGQQYPRFVLTKLEREFLRLGKQGPRQADDLLQEHRRRLNMRAVPQRVEQIMLSKRSFGSVRNAARVVGAHYGVSATEAM